MAHSPALFTQADDNMQSNGGRPSSSSSSPVSTNTTGGLSAARTAGTTCLRTLLIDLPLLILFTALITSLILQHVYFGYVGTLVDSLRRGHTDARGFYPEFNHDFTYYNRQCDADDITTTDANDLLILTDDTPDQAADTMMRHGAVVFKNVLSNETATDLRVYLEARHKIQDELPWHEKFFEEQDRLALGLGAHDDPTITRALVEVGTNPVVKRALTGILGDDPAIAEISTMTSMSGASNQGIHTDSDYFGSSLLYSRTFLHSYTMFMSLQDTTTAMGATTLCPGSHHCANEDLEDVCLDNGAFEASSNGLTGQGGILEKGDAMMFNQNVWHRGASNNDPLNRHNRVMFIITFVSRTHDNPGDRRYQGLGTYYYQRFNMWGHTYDDLKDAGSVMGQPLAALRAYGIYKPKGRKWGITWIEHFARELANREHFYHPGELRDFVEFLDEVVGVPKFLQGTYGRTYQKKHRQWEPFLEDLIDNTVAFLVKVNAAVLGLYMVVRLVLWAVFASVVGSAADDDGEKEGTGTPEGRDTRKRQSSSMAFVRRIVLTHGSVCILGYLFVFFLDRTELARSAKSGEVFVRPFPDADKAQGMADDGSSSSIGPRQRTKLGPTTVPERNDVLIGTRFDADFLASFNRMLDYHPGDQRFHSIVDSFATNLPPALRGHAVRTIVDYVQEEMISGVTPRFVLQDPYNGYWTVMPDGEVLEVTRRSLMMKESGLKDGLGRHLKSVLADSRFGAMRDTVLSRRYTPLFVAQWEEVVFGSGVANKKDATDQAQARKGSDFLAVRSFVSPPALLAAGHWRAEASTAYHAERDLLRRSKADPEGEGLEAGDRVVSKFAGTRGRWLEAKISKVYSDEEALLAFTDGHYNRMPTDKIRRYQPLVEGDAVEVQYNSGEGDWYKARIAKAHPLGTYDILYDDGDKDSYVEAQYIRRVEAAPPVTLKVDPDMVDTLVVADRVEANYKGRGEWYEAYVRRVNDDGTFYLYYTDGSGDKEKRVPRNRIRYKE